MGIGHCHHCHLPKRQASDFAHIPQPNISKVSSDSQIFPAAWQFVHQIFPALEVPLPAGVWIYG